MVASESIRQLMTCLNCYLPLVRIARFGMEIALLLTAEPPTFHQPLMVAM
jgi:hypothetical protein